MFKTFIILNLTLIYIFSSVSTQSKLMTTYTFIPSILFNLRNFVKVNLATRCSCFVVVVVVVAVGVIRASGNLYENGQMVSSQCQKTESNTNQI